MKKLLKIFTLFSAISMITTTAIVDQQVFAEEKDITAEIDYSVKLGKQNHLVHLTVCANEETEQSSTIIIYSPQDSEAITLQKVLPTNTCQSYEVEIKAKYANRIGVIVA